MKARYKSLTNFLEKNTLRKEDIRNLDAKIIALKAGLISYYETYSIYSGSLSSFLHYIDKTNKSEIEISKGYGTEQTQKYFSTITNINLFFEIYIKEILEKINPILSKQLDKQGNLISAIAGNFNSPNLPSNFIDYAVALDRIKQLKANHGKLPRNYRLKIKYSFIADEFETLNELRKLRNAIIHSGQEVLNLYAFETFMVNRVMPLIRMFLKLKKKDIFLERRLFCKLNVIDELCKIKLEERSFENDKYEQLENKLRHVNHLKELGRASFIKNVLIKGEVSKFQYDNVKEKNKSIKKTAINKALLNIRMFDHYKTYLCPCCGCKSLTSFDYWNILANNKIRVQTVECTLCTYKININIGEPFEFKIMKEKVFVYIE